MNYLPMKENREFRRVYARGKYYVSPILVSYVIKNRRNRNHSAVGITTSKKTGNAVHRNRSRRIIREAFRSMEDSIMPGYSFVFVARGKTPFVKCGDVCRIMRQHLKNAGVLQ